MSQDPKIYEDMDVNQVVLYAKEGDRAAYNFIIQKYKRYIKGLIKRKNYFVQGGDPEDLYQEGLFGLFKAIRDFDINNGSRFEVFFKIVIDRHLISAIKIASRKKHKPLNDMISFDRTLPENANLSMMDIFGSRDDIQNNINLELIDPEEQLGLQERFNELYAMLDESLSEREKDIFKLYVEGLSYKQIKVVLGIKKSKTIDNAIQRVKRKIEKIKNNEIVNKRKKM